jgi:protein involved in polysaccharide export with SLBB domain
LALQTKNGHRKSNSFSRRLTRNTPTLQINIANYSSKQVNVQGDVKPENVAVG